MRIQLVGISEFQHNLWNELTTLADGKVVLRILNFPGKRVSCYIQTVSKGNNMDELSNCNQDKQKKYKPLILLPSMGTVKLLHLSQENS